MNKLFSFMLLLMFAVSASAWTDPVTTNGQAFQFVETNVEGFNVYENENYTLKTSANCELPDGVETSISQIGNPVPTSFGPTDTVTWDGSYCAVHSLTRNINSVVEYSVDTQILFLKNVVMTQGETVVVLPSATLQLVDGKFELIHVDTGQPTEVTAR